MRIRALLLGVTLLCISNCLGFASENQVVQGSQQWSPEKAWRWYKAQSYLVGFNYIPSNAINTTEMWQKETFDPVTIDRELALAQEIGLNCARVFVQYLVWQNDPAGLKQRMDTFLAIAAKHGIKTMFVLFDDCAFGTMTEPFLGKQPDVVPGEQANGWTPSPGSSRVTSEKAWPKLEAYMKDVIGAFRSDQRVLAWDVYNEPGNTNLTEWFRVPISERQARLDDYLPRTDNKSLPLLRRVFPWARQAAPTQPLTVAVWYPKFIDLNSVILGESDIISFHRYGGPDDIRRTIAGLRTKGRPLICTEWLNRPVGSTFANILPILYQDRIGSMFWGLVNGKTQTNYQWGSKAGDPPPRVWQHDIFHGDYTPYDQSEIDLLRKYIRMSLTAPKR